MNKEIEEMIKNRIEDIYQSGEYIYQAKELEEILSYIEQLKVDYKEANESVIWWTNRFNAIEKDNRNLKNNRDKAIEYINEMSGYDVEDYIRQDLLLLLKGDSE